MNLEEHFLYSCFIRADDLFIADSVCMISKNYIKSKVLKIVKNCKDIFAESKGIIPIEQGTPFDINTGTKCLLCPDEKIGIIYNKKYLFDYNYLSMLVKQVMPWHNINFYVVENKKKEPLLQLYDENDRFIGCFIAMVRKKG